MSRHLVIQLDVTAAPGLPAPGCAVTERVLSPLVSAIQATPGLLLEAATVRDGAGGEVRRAGLAQAFEEIRRLVERGGDPGAAGFGAAQRVRGRVVAPVRVAVGAALRGSGSAVRRTCHAGEAAGGRGARP